MSDLQEESETECVDLMVLRGRNGWMSRRGVDKGRRKAFLCRSLVWRAMVT